MSSAGSHNVIGPQSGGVSDTVVDTTTSTSDKKNTGPGLYDPMDQTFTSTSTSSNMGPDSRAPPDTGSNSSDTTTQQNAIYFYKPFAMLPFPKADGPPIPYTDDFSKFQK